MDEALNQVRSLLAEAIKAAGPILSLGDGRGTFIVDELKAQLRSSGVARPARKVAGTDVKRFDEFWALYPGHRRHNKPACLRKWVTDKLDEHTDEVLAGLNHHLNCSDWRKEEGRFVPNCLTFLNQRRWEIGTAVNDSWAKAAGFTSRYEAENAGCYAYNAHKFSEGRRA